MSGHQNQIEAGPAVITSPALGAQIARNRVIYEHWQQDCLVEARGILADFAHHPDTLVVLACRVICAHGSDAAEHADALGVSRLLGSRLSEASNTALNGGAA